jgi:hypothetical protein
VLGRCWGGATCGSPTRLGAMPERVKLPSEAEPEASRAMTLISTSVWRSCHSKWNHISKCAGPDLRLACGGGNVLRVC